MYQGADKSLARPGRKQATATKLLILQDTQKKKIRRLSVQPISAAAMTSASEEKWRPFNYFFSRVGLRTYQHPCVGRYNYNSWKGNSDLPLANIFVLLLTKNNTFLTSLLPLIFSKFNGIIDWVVRENIRLRVRSSLPGKRTGGNVTRTSTKTNVSNFTSALRPLREYTLTVYVQGMP